MNGRLPLSILVVARNEERNLPDCLASAGFADEVVVQLDRSTDGSAEIAERAGARILRGDWPNEGARRNYGIAQCRHDWVLELDADERVSPELRDELTRLLPGLAYGHYAIPFHNFIGGVYVRHGWGAYNGVSGKFALFAKGAKIWGDGEVHPQITLQGAKGYLSGHIDHYVDADLAGMVNRLNRYSTGAAKDAIRTGAIPGGWNTARRLFSRFIRAYWGLKAHREGWRGLALALFSALYPLLTYLKIRELQDRAKR